MSLYPGWGVGGRIKIRGWTRRFCKVDGEQMVEFKVDTDSVERFGYFRSMDILRLWASNGLSNVAAGFFEEIRELDTAEAQAAKRRRLETEINSAVEKAVANKNIFIYTTTPADSQSADITFNVYKYEPPSATGIRNASLEKTDLRAIRPSTFCNDVLGMAGLPASKSAPRAHYGFNETPGVRRWMLNAGLKIFRKNSEATEMVDSSLNAGPEDQEVMRDVLSLDTLRTEFADTLVAAVAGMVVEAKSPSPEAMQYVMYDADYTTLNPLHPGDVHPPRASIVSGTAAGDLTRGIQSDGLVPLEDYVNPPNGVTPMELRPTVVIGTPFGRSLRYSRKPSCPEISHYFTATAPSAVSGHMTHMHPAGDVAAQDYVVLRGVAISAGEGAAKAGYAVKHVPETLQVTSDAQFTWERHEASGAYGLKVNQSDKWVVEVELLPCSGVYAPVPLQLKPGRPFTFVSQFGAQGTTDTFRHFAALVQLAGPGSSSEVVENVNEKANRLQALWDRGEADVFRNAFRTEVELVRSANANVVNSMAPIATGHTGAIAPPPHTTDFLYEGCNAHWHSWHEAFRRNIRDQQYYVLQITLSSDPPMFVPFDEGTKEILWTTAQIAERGYDYVQASDFERVAFCEELYRPAAYHAAHPEDVYDEDNTNMQSMLMRPHGYASMPQSAETIAFMRAVRDAADAAARSTVNADNVLELVPVEEAFKRQSPPDTKLIEFYAPGDNVMEGWSMYGTPMSLIDALELGVAHLDALSHNRV